MKQINNLAVISIFIFSLCGCSLNDTIVESTQDTKITTESTVGIFEGVLRVKFTPEIGESFYYADNASLRCGDTTIDRYLSEIGAQSMTRVFPNTGKYEERKRREGLHLWYDITFVESSKTTIRAVTEMRNLKGIEIAETVRKIPVPNNRIIVMPSGSTPTRADYNQTFNDPLFPYQWHYENKGKFIRHVEGADINLSQAWKVEVGKPEVIVAIVDGGVDLNHEDLADNIYSTNKGYNFVTHTDIINPHPHGTHVAGTVAARNNNGIGVCGVAGGDGTAHSGVRLMSCQVFDVDPKTNKSIQARNFGEALVYAADNGAVIAQNSWGYGYPGPGALDPSLQAAIDYFIKYAGCDENGNQNPDSPMKGGVVIFAAGNEGQEYLAYPGAYSEVIAVSAMSPDYMRTDYTNLGEWIDIMAPGGSEYFERGGVYSTLPGNKYGYMSGTSMACPHVSGIAALIVSKHGKQGFTNKDLKNRLLNSLLDEDIYVRNAKDFGKLGYGYIDAFKALAEDHGLKPEPVTSIEVTPDFSSLNFLFTAVKDGDDKTASTYNLYYSQERITDLNSTDLQTALIPAHHIKLGEKISYKVANLEYGTFYYFAIVAVDRWGHESSPFYFEAKTNENHPAKLRPSIKLPVKVSETETTEFVLNVDDPENHQWTFAISGDVTGVSYERIQGGILFRIKGGIPVGKYRLRVEVEDYFFAKSQIEIPFEIYVNHPPKITKIPETIYVPIAGNFPKGIDLSKYFVDEDGDILTYTATSRDSEYLSVGLTDGRILDLKALGKRGNTVVYVEACDVHGRKARISFSVRIVEDNFVFAVYPIPASKELNLVIREDVKLIEIEVRTPNGILVSKRTVQFDAKTSRRVVFDINNIPIGTYILTVRGEAEIYTTTFVKI